MHQLNIKIKSTIIKAYQKFDNIQGVHCDGDKSKLKWEVEKTIRNQS